MMGWHPARRPAHGRTQEERRQRPTRGTQHRRRSDQGGERTPQKRHRRHPRGRRSANASVLRQGSGPLQGVPGAGLRGLRAGRFERESAAGEGVRAGPGGAPWEGPPQAGPGTTSAPAWTPAPGGGAGTPQEPDHSRVSATRRDHPKGMGGAGLPPGGSPPASQPHTSPPGAATLPVPRPAPPREGGPPAGSPAHGAPGAAGPTYYIPLRRKHAILGLLYTSVVCLYVRMCTVKSPRVPPPPCPGPGQTPPPPPAGKPPSWLQPSASPSAQCQGTFHRPTRPLALGMGQGPDNPGDGWPHLPHPWTVGPEARNAHLRWSRSANGGPAVQKPGELQPS